MKIIRTKFHPPTSSLPARVSARAEGGNSVIQSYTGDRDHDRVAIALCEKMGWRKRDLVGGDDEKNRGRVYVFLDQDAIVRLEGPAVRLVGWTEEQYI